MLNSDEKLNRIYLNGTRIKKEDINISEREFYRGFLTDIMDDRSLDIKISIKNLIQVSNKFIFVLNDSIMIEV